MVLANACRAAALGLLGILTVTSLASTRSAEDDADSPSHATTTRLSMLRRHRQELSSSPLLQVWDEHCKRKGECGKHPKVPKQAYLINLPQDQAKLEYSQRLLAELGLNVEVIEGTKSVQVGSLEEYSECLPAGSATDCQAGLTLSHMKAWQALAHSAEYAAWVFEDDVIFHDDFLSIFPSYWTSVPSDFKYIAVGMIPRHFNVSQSAVYVSPDKMPWGTHAYIVTSRQAESMLLTATMMIERSKHPSGGFHSTSWQLDGEDFKIDHYLSMYYSRLTPMDDKRRWVVFDSPPEQPFKYGNVSWTRNGGCQCSCANLAACAAEGRAPAWGMGLVAQHTCREQVERLPIWHQEMLQRSANGPAEKCTELRACGTFVCEYERLYNDEFQPTAET